MIIVSVSHPGSGATTHRLDAPVIRVGREVDNDIVLESYSCSRYHAEIRREAGVYSIFDCGSTNGVVIGGDRVAEAKLESDCVATLGEHELSFSIPPQLSAKTVMMELPNLEAAPPPQAAPKAPATLYLHLGEKGKETSVKIAAGVEYTLGRSPGCDVVVDDGLCSGRHALIFSRDAGFFIRDLGSANGTLLNGEKIQEARFEDGDNLLLGKTGIAVSDQQRDAVDEDILLARTQLGLPAMAELRLDGKEDPLRSREPNRASAGRRNLIAALVLVAVAVLVTLLVLKVTDTLRAPPTEVAETSSSSTSGNDVLVQVSRVQMKELAFSVTGAGSVEPRRRVTVSAEVPGLILEIPVVEGLAVRAGDLLVRLDDQEVRLAIQEASSSITREQVDLARGEYERRQRLFDTGALTGSALNQAKTHYLSLDSAYRTAQARIAQLRKRQEKARVIAPIAATVARIIVNPGELAGPGSPLLVLEDSSEVLVVVEVSDREVVKVRPLQVVEATSDAFPRRIFQGVVDKVDTTANPISKAFEVEARIDNSDGSLRAGMITSIRVLHDKRSSLVVPAEALMGEVEGRAEVFLIRDGIARKVSVELGGRFDREVEVSRGLAANDEVVVFGHEGLEDGQAVQTYASR